MTHTRRDEFIKNIFSITAPYIDRLTVFFSLGLSRIWRRKAVELADVQEGDVILDVCTGTGELAFMLIEKLSMNGSLMGLDFCPEMIEIAERKLKNSVHSNPPIATFMQGDAKSIPLPSASFDLVTVSFGMRNIPDTKAALREIWRVLRPGGRFVCLELTRPVKRWFLPIYKWYVFRLMPLIGRIVIKKSTPYTYLPRSIEAFYPPDEFRRVIAECGFADVKTKAMTLGVATIFTAVKPNSAHPDKDP